MSIDHDGTGVTYTQLAHARSIDSDTADQVRSWRWGRGAIAALSSAVLVGVPTDVIDTAWFTRMTPVRWWEYPALGLTAALTGLWFAIVLRVADDHGRAGVLSTSALSALAVGCPVCNKIVIALLGVSGALGIWAPIQPFLALLSLAALSIAVFLRWRRSTCTAPSCSPGGSGPAAGE